MNKFWVIDTTCTILPTSSVEQDGSDFYYNRAVSPAATKEEAVSCLSSNFSGDGISIRNVVDVVSYEDGDWSNDIYNIGRAYQKAKQENRVCTAAFISSDVYDFKYKDVL